MTCALIGMSCNTERLRVQRVATVSNAATRSAVAPRCKSNQMLWACVAMLNPKVGMGMRWASGMDGKMGGAVLQLMQYNAMKV